jgi:hypothetical protein
MRLSGVVFTVHHNTGFASVECRPTPQPPVQKRTAPQYKPARRKADIFTKSPEDVR